MIRQVNSKVIRHTITGVLFVIYFLYFALLNRHHIHYLEQSQLFILSFDFLKEQFSLPGGFVLYSGSFFTQFFVSSLPGAFFYTLNAFGVFVLSSFIFKKHNFENVIVSFVPVWLLAILQSNEFFTFGQAIGFLLILAWFALYVSFDKSASRYTLFFAGWPFFYLLTGGFSIFLVLLCSLHELLFRKGKEKYLVCILYILAGALVPYLSAHILYYIQPDKIYSYPVVYKLPSIFSYAIILLLAWTPILLLSVFLTGKAESFRNRFSQWNITNLLAGTVIVIFMAAVVYKRAYNKMAEMMLGADYYTQHNEWDKVLKLSGKYPGYNTLIIYYTNLALYKSDILLDKMFSYPQIGSEGLRLKWQRNLNLFFGGEVFYQLAYNNESIHWAFEALVSNGRNPRSLKRLAVGCLVNGNYDIAQKYLCQLDKTLFYRHWAKDRLKYLNGADPAVNDPEISQAHNLLVSTNFFSEVNGMNLQDLLRSHPENKMAYEYLLASLLLDRDLDGFAKEVRNLKYYGFERMPLHVEEALIFYNFYENKNIVPDGYSFNPGNIKRFNDYARTYSTLRKDRKVAATELKKKYGKTFWYYLQFPGN